VNKPIHRDQAVLAMRNVTQIDDNRRLFFVLFLAASYLLHKYLDILGDNLLSSLLNLCIRRV